MIRLQSSFLNGLISSEPLLGQAKYEEEIPSQACHTRRIDAWSYSICLTYYLEKYQISVKFILYVDQLGVETNRGQVFILTDSTISYGATR